jgi:hypothetical protein
MCSLKSDSIRTLALSAVHLRIAEIKYSTVWSHLCTRRKWHFVVRTNLALFRTKVDILFLLIAEPPPAFTSQHRIIESGRKFWNSFAISWKSNRFHHKTFSTVQCLSPTTFRSFFAYCRINNCAPTLSFTILSVSLFN